MQNLVTLVGKPSKKLLRPGTAVLTVNDLGYVKF